MKYLLLALLLGSAAAVPAVAADAGDPGDGLEWLKKMANASRRLNYVGTFVYRSPRQAETSRIVHFVNSAGGEIEKLETLDGPPREVIRTNDQVTCYLPDARTVIIEQRVPRRFPALLPERLTGLADSYDVRVAGRDRVADRECQAVVLVPRDKLRYGHYFCADVQSGLPLRSRSYDDRQQLLESFAFTQLEIGAAFRRDLVRSRYATRSRDWKVDRHAIPVAESAADTGWVLANQLPGFRKMTELRRSVGSRGITVAHLVFSDGFAAISVFIEPLPGRKPVPHLSHKGAVNIYSWPVAEYMVTALGEAPAATVMQLAKSLEYKGSPARQ